MTFLIATEAVRASECRAGHRSSLALERRAADDEKSEESSRYPDPPTGFSWWQQMPRNHLLGSQNSLLEGAGMNR